MIALSHEVDHELAEFLMRVVSDGIIAPSFAPGVVERLSTKKKESFLVLQAHEDVVLPEWEVREIGAGGSMRRQDRFNRQMAAAAIPTAERQDWLTQLDEGVVTHDGFIPFRDNIDGASKHGVVAVVEPGGSVRSDDVDQACREHQITRVQTGLRLFHH